VDYERYAFERKKKYNKNIDGWNFDYEEQGEWNNKKLFHDEIQKAIEYSEKKKWSFAYANKI